MGSGGAPVIDAALVRRLLFQQAAHWSELPIVPVERQGWDNRTFRLGDRLSVRLPSRAAYAGQIVVEADWLPVLAAGVSLEIPSTAFLGEPSDDYPFGWAVRRWIDGESATVARISDRGAFAASLGGFLRELQSVEPDGGPSSGERNFHRGGDLRVYEQQARDAMRQLRLDQRATAIWRQATASRATQAVWVHGDIAPGNLLVRDGRLTAVIDFGLMSVGDPACDYAIAWTFLDSLEREAFRSAAGADDETWSRARGWALWKSAMVCAGRSGGVQDHPVPERTLAALLDEE